MERGDLLDALVALAEEAGVTVRVLPRGAGASSGPCRIRGEPWLLIAADDSLEERIDAAAGALRDLGPAWLEGRFLPPALRERIERAARAPAGGAAEPD